MDSSSIHSVNTLFMILSAMWGYIWIYIRMYVLGNGVVRT